MDKTELMGGRAGKIYKSEDTVIRPANAWTKNVHCFLNYLQEEGVGFVPKPYGIDKEGNEILSFMHGDVYNYPLPEMFMSDSMIISSAKLLLAYHQYSEGYIAKLTYNEPWMLPVVYPVEVMCHGDFAPYNVTITDNKATGMIDFDTLHPGPRMWDIVYAIYRWVPFTSSDGSGFQGDLEEQIRRAKLFFDTYGAAPENKERFVEWLIRRLQCLVEFMHGEAEKGNRDFQKNIEEGHHEVYLTDIAYLEDHRAEITAGIRY